MATELKPEHPLDIENLSYTFSGQKTPAIGNINLNVNGPQFILLIGPQSCGKTTLVNCINGVNPHLTRGHLEGKVLIFGKDTRTHEMYELAKYVGTVFQSPGSQIFSIRVVDEVALGIENLGLPHEQIVERVDRYMRLLGIEGLAHELTFGISGGQQQRVSLASNLAILQEITMLDDPLTDLDPIGKHEVVSAISKLHKELGNTFLLVEHDLTDVLEIADRLIVLTKDGTIWFDGTPADVLREHYDSMARGGILMPPHIDLTELLTRGARSDFTIDKERIFKLLEKWSKDNLSKIRNFKLSERRLAISAEPIIDVRELHFWYHPEKPVLKGINLQISQGEFVAIIGENGGGKTTLVKNIIGLLRPSKGDVLVKGKSMRDIPRGGMSEYLGYVFQDPDNQLFTESVDKELRFSLELTGMPRKEADERIGEVLKLVGLEAFRDRHPFSLSRGQRQKVALASVLVQHPEIIVLDEPTTGQDRLSLSAILGIMEDLIRTKQSTIIMITHDMDTVASYASRIVVIGNGQVVLDAPTRKVFFEHYEILDRLKLRMPVLAQFARDLEGYGFPQLMNIREYHQLID